jgi:thymidylate synthase ThyX
MFKSKKIKEILNPKNLPIGEIKTLYANEHLDIIYEACTACYDNTKELTQIQKREYVKKRVLAGHTSVLEHGWLTMVIKDMHPFHLHKLYQIFLHFRNPNQFLLLLQKKMHTLT